MNNKYKRPTALITLSITLVLSVLLSIVSCSKDSKDSEVKPVDPNVEKLDDYTRQLTALRDTSVYGTLAGTYPQESKQILTPVINEANKYILLIKYGDAKPSQSDIDKCYANLEKAVADFKASKRTEDALVPAELYVNGMNGGYIDFGSSPEYSVFGDPGNQQFTVETWFKFTNINGFGAAITTFYENGGNRIRKGWMVNHFDNQRLRMSYSMSAYDNMLEPGADLPMSGFGNTWVHFAAVYSDNGFNGERDGNGNLIVIKVYRNGQLVSTATKRNSNDKYVGNDLPMSMTAFLEIRSDGSTTRKISGFIKDFHIWKTAKTEAEINQLKNKEIVVSGTETDLACGWDFSKTVRDENNIRDLTGRHAARLIGEHRWDLK